MSHGHTTKPADEKSSIAPNLRSHIDPLLLREPVTITVGHPIPRNITRPRGAWMFYSPYLRDHLEHAFPSTKIELLELNFQPFNAFVKFMNTGTLQGSLEGAPEVCKEDGVRFALKLWVLCDKLGGVARLLSDLVMIEVCDYYWAKREVGIVPRVQDMEYVLENSHGSLKVSSYSCTSGLYRFFISLLAQEFAVDDVRERKSVWQPLFARFPPFRTEWIRLQQLHWSERRALLVGGVGKFMSKEVRDSYPKDYDDAIKWYGFDEVVRGTSWERRKESMDHIMRYEGRL
ncbi:hypothetical protein BDV96DRAFT_645670 [Lophiotrema nucula]|uniref:Uncharacterized protein n=1 Tax=Lophiotrema nucula TaxID=690887 RepID=A0A6A5ZA48_9PLEO|nr:hypothetical protein BDV96DRAFT_645670 [Lophiotrema nucula]